MDDQKEPIRAGETLPTSRPAPSWAIVISAVVVAVGAVARKHPASVLAKTEQAADGLPRQQQTSAPPRHSGPGWKNLALRIFYGISEDRILLIAAGVTFYSILALFPGIAAIISIYGLFSDPSHIVSSLNVLSGVAPGGAVDVLREQLVRLANQDRAALGFGFAISLIIALWSANAGVSALFQALTAVYEEKEERSLVKFYAMTLAFTLGGVVLVLLSLAILIGLPLVLHYVPHSGAMGTILKLSRWPILFVLIALALSVIYRYGPSRSAPRWHLLTWGSAFAAIGWLVASALFSWYVANFGSYNKTYGSLGAIIGFMTWMWVSTVVVLVGAKLDAEIERPTTPAKVAGSPSRSRLLKRA